MASAFVLFVDSLRAAVEKFVPPITGDQLLGLDAQRRGRILVWGSFALVLGASFVLGLRTLALGHIGNLFPMFLFGIAVVCATPFVLRASQSLRVAGLLPITVVAVSLPIAATFSGGPHAPAIVFMPLVPLLATFFAGRRVGAVFTILIAYEGLGLYFAELFGFNFVTEIDSSMQHLLILSGVVIATIVAGTLAYAFEAQRSRTEVDRQAMYADSIRDSLTLTYNRRYFDQRMQEEIAYAKRHKAPLSLLLVDIDHFKRINDRHGHSVGDAVLCEVVVRLQQILRSEDILARFGGEEFVVGLRGTSAEGAGLAGERLRKAVDVRPIEADKCSIGCTVSVGCAALDFEDPKRGSLQTLLETADRRLYTSKSGGRNRVTADG